jgi:uncharacterized protein
MKVFRKIIIPLLCLLMVYLLSACSHEDKTYWPDGSLKSVIPRNSRGQIEGTAKWWYENGQLMMQAVYHEDSLNGLSQRWHSNGKKQSEETYVMGRRNGNSIEWDAMGHMITRKNYVNDTLEGEATQWYDNGSRQVEGRYLHGNFEGRWLYFDRLENLIGEGTFRQGEGVVKSWNDQGKVIRTAEYKNNRKNGKEIWYNDDGKKIKEVIYKDGDVVSEQDFTP